jgi:uncharacterized protein YjbJ (UPF0337 family)
METKLKLETPWSEVKEKLKEHNVQLTDEDLQYTPGKEDELLERLGQKMHRSKTELRDYIESVSANRTKAG